jgi:hypothetical protein
MVCVKSTPPLRHDYGVAFGCIGALALKAGYNSLKARSWSSMTDDSFRDCFSSLFIFEALELLRTIRWHGVDMVEETL